MQSQIKRTGFTVIELLLVIAVIAILAWMLLPPDGNSVVESAGEQAIRAVRLPTLAGIDVLKNGHTKRP